MPSKFLLDFPDWHSVFSRWLFEGRVGSFHFTLYRDRGRFLPTAAVEVVVRPTDKGSALAKARVVPFRLLTFQFVTPGSRCVVDLGELE